MSNRFRPYPASLNKQRDKDEKPSRTLFVRNISYDVTAQKIEDLFAQYGDIRKTFSLVEKRGLSFITYNDVRAAERAKRELTGTMLSGRPIDVHFSLPRDSGDDKSVIEALLKGAKDPTNREEMVKFFEKFGEIKELRDVPDKGSLGFLIEYFDMRDCEEAVTRGHNASFAGGRWSVDFVRPEEPPSPPRRDRGSPRRGSDDRVDRGYGGRYDDEGRRGGSERYSDHLSDSARLDRLERQRDYRGDRDYRDRGLPMPVAPPMGSYDPRIAGYYQMAPPPGMIPVAMNPQEPIAYHPVQVQMQQPPIEYQAAPPEYYQPPPAGVAPMPQYEYVQVRQQGPPPPVGIPQQQPPQQQQRPYYDRAPPGAIVSGPYDEQQQRGIPAGSQMAIPVVAGNTRGPPEMASSQPYDPYTYNPAAGQPRPRDPREEMGMQGRPTPPPAGMVRMQPGQVQVPVQDPGTYVPPPTGTAAPPFYGRR